MAINEQGYLRPTFDDLLESRIEQAKELFGEDIDTSNDSPLGKFIRLAVQDLADAYEEQEVIYYSRFPHTATGQSLDRLMPFAGISRNPATRAEHTVRFYGTSGYTVPTGFLVGTAEGEEFYLTNPVMLNQHGEEVGIVQCTELGTVGNVPPGAISVIINPDADVMNIEHLTLHTNGADEETDAELRKRFDAAIEGSGSGTMASIRGAVMRVNGVTGCLIVENPENEADEYGRPPHSFEVYVKAPESLDQAVAEAIFSKKPFGIKTTGDVSVEVMDVSGKMQTVYFSRVAETQIHIVVKVLVDAHFEIDGVEKITDALVGYINGLTTGEDVIYNQLYRHIFGVTGVKDVTDLLVSTDGTDFTTGNVFMAEDDIASTVASNITVVVSDYEDA